MTSDPNKCTVAIRTSSGGLVKAFDVCIRGEDVYTNYSDSTTPEAHSSYHKSGQYHMKKGKRYIEWDGGPTGQMEPMKLYRTPPGLVLDRVRFWTVGWQVSNLNVVLPALTVNADMIVDATHIEPDAILAFEANIIGQKSKEQMNIVGYPVISSHRFGNAVLVEICSFVVRDEQENNSFDL
jgi:hypothetical protein